MKSYSLPRHHSLLSMGSSEWGAVLGNLELKSPLDMEVRRS
jgi:hypothetical protein